MDEKFDKLINGMFPNQNQYREKILNRELQIPGLHITVDGKDVRDILDSKGFSAFVEQDAARAQIEPSSLLNNPAIQDKEKLLTYFNGYSNDVEEYFQFNISIIHQIISSMVDLIPTELNNEEKRIAQCCLDFSKMISIGFTRVIESIQGFLSNDEKDENLNDLTKLNILRMHKSCLVYGSVELNFTIIYIMWYRQHVYDYFYGSIDKKDENADVIKQISNNVLQLLSPQLNNIKKDIDKIAKDNKKYIKEIKTIKNKQEKTDDKILRKSKTIIQKIENRNKVEHRKKLTQKYCAKIIRKKIELYNEKKEDFLKEHSISKYYREFSVPETNSIKREIQRWERFLKTNGKDGIKPPANFTRMTSEFEFDAFAERLELEKYNEWKAFITEKFLTVHKNNL